MVEHSTDKVFAALAHPVRRAIVARLAAEGSSTIGELAAPFEMSFEAVSKHTRVLEDAGLVRREREGRHRRCTLERVPLRALRAWLDDVEQTWHHRLDNLSDLLSNPTD